MHEFHAVITSNLFGTVFPLFDELSKSELMADLALQTHLLSDYRGFSVPPEGGAGPNTMRAERWNVQYAHAQSIITIRRLRKSIRK